MGSCLAELVIPLGLGEKEELFVLTSLWKRTCHPELAFQQLLRHSRTQGMWSCRQHRSRHTVGWACAGLAPKGACGSWTTRRRALSPAMGMLQGIIFQLTGAGGGTSLGFIQPSFPTALAVLSFILGQRLLIFLSWLSSLFLKGLNSVWATSHPQQLQQQVLRAAQWKAISFCGV